MDQEMRFHMEAYSADLVKSGVDPEEAERRARIEFGGIEVAQEQCRQSRGLRIFDELYQDFSFAGRMLRKNPGFTAVAILTLTIGIGASTTVYSWIRAVLLNPLPGVGSPERVVTMETLTADGNWKPTSYLDFRDLRKNCKLVESMSATKPMPLAVGDDGTIERVWSEAVSGNFFDMLRVSPEFGRFFSSEEVDYEQNAHALVVISHSFWASHYHSDPNIIGSTIRINHFPYTVVGVAPKTFRGSMAGLTLDMWVPVSMFGQLTSTGDSALVDRKWRTFRVLARLAPGVTLEQARAEVQSRADDLARENADTNQGLTATLLPMWKSHYGIQDSLLAPLTILMAASGVVLLLVCANLANLLLARSISRRSEFSIRLALGASRSRLIRQVLTESSVIAVAGSIAGLAAAYWLSGSLEWILPKSSTPGMTTAPIDAEVLLFAIGLSLVVTVLAGITPALHAASGSVNGMLKETNRVVSSIESGRLRQLFVVSEIALALVALIGAGLLVTSFRHVSEIKPGFDPEHVAMAKLDLSAANYNAQQADSFYRRLSTKLEQQPGITNVGYSDYVPLSVSAGSWEDLEIQGYVPSPNEDMKIYRSLISPGYFDLMKIPILEGRDFNLHDDVNNSPVMIVNQEFVRRFVSDQNAVGRRVQGWGKWFTIVGVVQDSKVYRLTETRTSYFYVPIHQIFRPEMGLAFFVRTSGSVDDAITTLRREARAADTSVPVFETSSMNDTITTSLFVQKISASLLSVLGLVALLLASIGLYGVMSYSVAQRTNEIGIRMALGAQRKNVFGLVLSQGARLTALGIGIGIMVALAITRLLADFLWGVQATDPATFAGVSALLIFVALLATSIPAYRAIRMDPVRALRT